jgi:hypothetical protein
VTRYTTRSKTITYKSDAHPGGSARRVYVPESLVGEAIVYADIDRADVIEQARTAGRYRRWRRPFMVEDPDRPIARSPDGGRVKVAQN